MRRLNCSGGLLTDCEAGLFLCFVAYGAPPQPNCTAGKFLLSLKEVSPTNSESWSRRNDERLPARKID